MSVTKMSRDWRPTDNESVYEPLAWIDPCEVHLSTDIFDPSVEYDFVDRVLATAAMADHHVYTIETRFQDRLAEYLDRIDQSEKWPDERRPELRDLPPLQDIGFWMTESFKVRGNEIRAGAPSLADMNRGWEHPSAGHEWPLPNVKFVLTLF